MTSPQNRIHTLVSTAAGIAVALGLTVAAATIGTSEYAAAQQERRTIPPDAGPDHGSEPVEPRKRPARPGQKDDRAAKAEPKPIPKSMRRPGGTAVPEGAGARAKLLDELYARLATAADETVAGRIANAIEHVWTTSGSETVDLLMDRARRALSDKKPELAVRLLDKAVQLAPDYPELFNRRAIVHAANSDLAAAIGDLRRVLALDPNNYRALEALGAAFKELGRKKAALEVYRRLYAVHPHFTGAKSTLDELAREVEGQDS